MKFVRNLESLLSRCIEGFFDKKFTSGLEPVELAKQLARLMDQERSISVSAIYAPNQYAVELHPEDYQRLESCTATIGRELSEYLTNHALRQGYTLVGGVSLTFSRNESTARGCPTLNSTFSQMPLPESPDAAASGDTMSRPLPKSALTPAVANGHHTQVFARVSAECPSCPVPAAKLTVTEGSDAGKTVSIGGGRSNIGRRESNELALTDLNTSRLHAYLAYEEGIHVLYDAKSLNGTYVNGHRITRMALKSGDQIKLGNTLLVYEVR